MVVKTNVHVLRYSAASTQRRQDSKFWQGSDRVLMWFWQDSICINDHVLCVCVCGLLLVGLWQRFYNDLGWVLHLQLPDGLLCSLPRHLLCNTSRLQTLLLQSGTHDRLRHLTKLKRKTYKCPNDTLPNKSISHLRLVLNVHSLVRFYARKHIYLQTERREANVLCFLCIGGIRDKTRTSNLSAVLPKHINHWRPRLRSELLYVETRRRFTCGTKRTNRKRKTRATKLISR